MTKPLAGKEAAEKIGAQLPQSVVEYDDTSVFVEPNSISQTCSFLNRTPGLEFDYIDNLTAVDYLDYFEVVYHLVSLQHNHSLVLKTRLHDRENPVVPSVTNIWTGADFQEREVWDLFGIRFEGHPNLKRILLWEGFEGHPLRRDFL
jgi:NADH-quinone oxidoreductase subunit C